MINGRYDAAFFGDLAHIYKYSQSLMYDVKFLNNNKNIRLTLLTVRICWVNIGICFLVCLCPYVKICILVCQYKWGIRYLIWFKKGNQTNCKSAWHHQMLTKQHQLLNRLESEQPFHASLLTYYCKICFDLQDISSLSWSYFVMSNKFACPNVGYKQPSILSHCNNAKFNAWFKKHQK